MDDDLQAIRSGHHGVSDAPTGRKAHYYRGSNLRGLRLMVVDDEFYIAGALANYLRDAGAQTVSTAATVAEAEHWLAPPRLDGAILDIRLGHDVVYRLADRVAEAQIPFLFYSADFFTLPPRFQAVRQIAKHEGFERVASALLVLIVRQRVGLAAGEADHSMIGEKVVRALRGMARALVTDPDAADDLVEEALRRAVAMAEAGTRVTNQPLLLADLVEEIWMDQKLSRPA